MSKKGFIVIEALISFFILLTVIESCYFLIIGARKINMKLIKNIENRYETKAKMEEILNKNYELISNENGVEVIEIEPGLKLISVGLYNKYKIVSLKNND